MCNCIIEIENVIPEKTGEWEGKKILSVIMQNVTFPIIKLKIQGKITTQAIELKLEGRKSPLKTSVSHSFCPFCGEKYLRE